MSNGKITTNVSGGSVSIGNITQGDRNVVGLQSSALDSAFGAFFSEIARLAATSDHSDSEVTALRADICRLQESLRTSEPSKESLVDKARRLYEKYGWAAGALKSLLAVVVPGLSL